MHLHGIKPLLCLLLLCKIKIWIHFFSASNWITVLKYTIIRCYMITDFILLWYVCPSLIYSYLSALICQLCYTKLHSACSSKIYSLFMLCSDWFFSSSLIGFLWYSWSTLVHYYLSALLYLILFLQSDPLYSTLLKYNPIQYTTIWLLHYYLFLCYWSVLILTILSAYSTSPLFIQCPHSALFYLISYPCSALIWSLFLPHSNLFSLIKYSLLAMLAPHCFLCPTFSIHIVLFHTAWSDPLAPPRSALHFLILSTDIATLCSYHYSFLFSVVDPKYLSF